MFKKAGGFFNEVKAEMRKVSWSSKRELLNSTWIVIVSVFLLTAFVGIVDLVISRAISFVIR